MKNNKTLNKIAGLDLVILDLPPTHNKYRNMVDCAVSTIQKGDTRFSPVDQIVFGKINLLAESGQLDLNRWHVISTGESSIVVSQEFLDIQNNFSQLEVDSSIQWDSEKCLDLLTNYLQVYINQRKLHVDLFTKTLNSLSTHGQVDLVNLIKSTWVKENGLTSFKQTLDNFINSNSLVAIPWVEDSSYVWQDVFKLPKQLTDRYSSVKKINEIGIIFASRLFRGTSAPSHDYFSYAHSVAKQRGISMEEMFLSTAKHEGSHGPLESLPAVMSKIPELSFISEGFPSAFGNDNREHDKADTDFGSITVDRLINQEKEINDTHKKTLIYIGGARFFKSMLNILDRKDTKESWVDISKNLFISANETKTTDEKDKLRFLTEHLLVKLQITKEEMDQELKSFEVS